MKRKIGLILGFLAAILLIVLSVTSTFLFPNVILEGKKEGQIGWKLIAVRTEAKEGLIGIGDLVSYKVIVSWKKQRIEFDKSSLDKTVNFEPFEVREVLEKEYDLDSETRIYKREYKIQLIDGERNKLYTFPDIVVRYCYKDSTIWMEIKSTPQPIFISARVPENVSDLELKPIKGKLINLSYWYMVWILIGLGGGFVAIGIVLLIKRIRKYRKEKREFRKRKEELRDFFEAYQKLYQRTLEKEEPKVLFHGLYQLLRLLLEKEEKIDWMEPDFNQVSPEIKPKVLDLVEKCREVSKPEPTSQLEIEQGLSIFEKILDFYLKKGGAES